MIKDSNEQDSKKQKQGYVPYKGRSISCTALL